MECCKKKEWTLLITRSRSIVENQRKKDSKLPGCADDNRTEEALLKGTESHTAELDANQGKNDRVKKRRRRRRKEGEKRKEEGMKEALVVGIGPIRAL